MITNINELRELLGKACPIPWKAERDEVRDVEEGYPVVIGTGQWQIENCALIAAAVNALPGLLDEIEALRAEVAKAGENQLKAIAETVNVFASTMKKYS